jgi:hypothetical protein
MANGGWDDCALLLSEELSNLASGHLSRLVRLNANLGFRNTQAGSPLVLFPDPLPFPIRNIALL